MSPTLVSAKSEAAPLIADGPVAAAAVGEPPSSLADTVADGMGVVVAPSTGRFRAHVLSGLMNAGSLLGVITGGGGRADEVRVPVRAEVCRLLAIEGQLVQIGQALAWIRLMRS